ncbi:TM9S4 protein, partial [Polypterus senegalus]
MCFRSAEGIALTCSRWTSRATDSYMTITCHYIKNDWAPVTGEVLRGDRIVNTPFQIQMNNDKKCEVLCNKPKKLTLDHSKLIAERIKEDYYVHLIADNLPVATRLEFYQNRDGEDEQKKESQKDVQFEHGYRLGFTDHNKVYLHNHLSFILYYHKEKVEQDGETTFRVVRFEVVPQSVKQEDLKVDDKGLCSLPEASSSSPQEIDPTKEHEVLFTYSVRWEESSIKWASRWDTYLTMSDVQIHWFSIVNSVVVVFFLSGILSMIIIRTLRKDIANYNKEDDIEDTMEESGWKNVHGDVFRPPQYPMILSSLLGSGIQLFCMVPFPTMLALLCMWFGISLPLVYLGYYFGFRKQPYDNPVRTNQIPRQIPEQRWYMNKFVGILMAGILPFGAMFIELFFIFSAIWENQFYYLFGFLFLVFIILVVSCSQISIVMVYFQLCAELDIVEFIPSLLYFGYTALMVLSFWLLTGTIGFYAAYMFIRKIYAAVKID